MAAAGGRLSAPGEGAGERSRPTALERLARPAFALPLLASLALLLRLRGLGESFWFDELFYATELRATTWPELWRSLQVSPPAPLYRVVLFAWIQLFGDGEVVARLPSLLCGVGTILLVYLAAREAPRAETAVVAALFLCFNPVHIWYSQEAAPYSMLLFFLSASWLLLHRLRSAPAHPLRLALYLGCLLAALFTHWFAAAFLVPFTALALAAPRQSRWRLLALHLLAALGLAAVLWARHRSDALAPRLGFLRPFSLFEWWQLFLHWFLHGNTIWTLRAYRADARALLQQPQLLACQLVFLAILVRGLVSWRQRADRTRALESLLLLATLPTALLVLQHVTSRPLYIERYLVALLPFFALALARGAGAFARPRVRLAATIVVLAVAIAAYVAFLGKPEEWTVYKPNPDWRSAARYFADRHDEPARTRIFGVSPSDVLRHYLRRLSPEERPRVLTFSSSGWQRVLENRDVRLVHLVKNRYWSGGFDGVLARVESEPRTTKRSTTSFQGVEIHTFALAPVSAPNRASDLRAGDSPRR